MKKPEWVLNLGTYSKKTKMNKSQPGLDMTRATMDTLGNKGHVLTNNCCEYFPTWPTYIVDDYGDYDTEFTKDIPQGGFYLVQQKDSPALMKGFLKYGATGVTGSLQIFDTD